MLRGKEIQEEREWERVQWQTAHIIGMISEDGQRQMLRRMKLERQLAWARRNARPI
jgi:hypothetical protein